MSVHTSFLDVMHVLDYKGITSHVAGGVMWSMITRKEFGRTYETSLEEINNRLTTFYTTNRVEHRL